MEESVDDRRDLLRRQGYTYRIGESDCNFSLMMKGEYGRPATRDYYYSTTRLPLLSGVDDRRDLLRERRYTYRIGESDCYFSLMQGEYGRPATRGDYYSYSTTRLPLSGDATSEDGPGDLLRAELGLTVSPFMDRSRIGYNFRRGETLMMQGEYGRPATRDYYYSTTRLPLSGVDDRRDLLRERRYTYRIGESDCDFSLMQGEYGRPAARGDYYSYSTTRLPLSGVEEGDLHRGADLLRAELGLTVSPLMDA